MTSAKSPRKPVLPKQELIAKLFHWLNLISLFAMIGSGLQIYNANPVFGGRTGFHFPGFLALGGWLAGGRHWHFFFMWIFGLNLFCYGLFVFISRRWNNRYVSQADLKALKQASNPKRKNYAWHRILYTLLIPVILMALLTGLGMYKPVQFGWIVWLFGSWQALRIVHFSTIPIVLGLMIAHSLLALNVGNWKLVRSMFT